MEGVTHARHDTRGTGTGAGVLLQFRDSPESNFHGTYEGTAMERQTTTLETKMFERFLKTLAADDTSP